MRVVGHRRAPGACAHRPVVGADGGDGMDERSYGSQATRRPPRGAGPEPVPRTCGGPLLLFLP
ncbi:hypothetical protein DVS28_a3081 [Euzebya pacifica]|uniref:Uncharacterized protein n=1 Tax=Euzebya pacifica TaxID=1608957 RepID=A0A346XZW0_9ACTN|nr:hypothetical protein DVS28_a3081 [Euzebya pacifica]